MKRIQENRSILHAVIWIVVYIIIVNVGDSISKTMGIDALVTVILLTAFSLILIAYLKKNNWFTLYGFNKIKQSDLRKTLFYIPLLLTIPLHYFRGINQELGYITISLLIMQMVCVGFIEELLFRGFLYQGILKKRGMKLAIIISGTSFGIGHIVNLARGYTIEHQIIQVVVGIFVGILLALIVALTNNILPCILWHMLYNISGTITNSNQKMETYMVIITSMICIIYSAYLIRTFKSVWAHRVNSPCN